MKSSDPIPQVPEAAAQPQGPVNPTVRSVILLLVAFAMLNIAREVTYIIGSIQAYGTILISNATGFMQSMIMVAAAAAVAYGLYRRESWARWCMIVGGSLWSAHLLYELIYMLQMRADNQDRTELQIVLFSCMLWTLAAGVLLLVSAKGKAEFTR